LIFVKKYVSARFDTEINAKEVPKSAVFLHDKNFFKKMWCFSEEEA